MFNRERPNFNIEGNNTMRVSDLAKELGISAEDILGKLKAMRLKAKDSKQELNEAVEAVIRREFKHVAKSAAKAEPAKAIIKTVKATETKEKMLKKIQSVHLKPMP